jgi:hypothetical protein
MTKTLHALALTLTIAMLLPLTAAAQFGEDEEKPPGHEEDAAEPKMEGEEPTIEASFDSGGPSGWMFGVAPRVGLDIPTSALNPFLALGLEFDVWLPVLDNRLMLAADFAFTYPREDGSGNDPRLGGAYDYETKVLVLKWAIDASWRFFPPDRTLIPFAGLGFVVQYLRTAQTMSTETGTNTERNGAPGFEIFGGLDWKLGIGYLFGDVRFAYTDLDHRFTGDINAGNVTICVGYRFVF